MKITLICGLPGSGKSYLGKQLAGQGKDTVYIDDISVTDNGMQQLKNALGTEHIIISDVTLCRVCVRDSASKAINHICKEAGFVYDIEWIFFENNPEKCLRNVDYRNDLRLVEESIKRLTKEYVIPTDVTTREIWQPSLQCL